MSATFVRTLRDDPADAEVPSHRLLVRAGYIRRVSSGGYAWLPLGLRVLRNVERVVREEMDRVGGQEVHLPEPPPRGSYAFGSRWDEPFALLAKAELVSYRDLPLLVYQVRQSGAVQRPGSRLGEDHNLMKDAYSFDLDDAALAKSYAAVREAYLRVFARLGLTVRAVAAHSGAMGGSASEEFLAPAPVGEDTFVACAACGYAANVEVVPSVPAPAPPGEAPPMTEVPTPGSATIETLTAALGVPASATLKNVLVMAGDEVVGVGVPGDREVDLNRLRLALAPAPVRVFEAADFAARPDLVRGYAGPQRRAYRYLADRRVAPGTAWVTGANKPGVHVRDAVADRDFTVDEYLDVATVAPGDPCPSCGGPLALDRGVEVGHVFQLGRKYTDAFGVDVPGPDGAPVRLTMGSYGIGVSRAVAVIAEQHADERGLVWPREVSPYDVHVVPVGRGEQPAHAADLADRLSVTGLRVLLDDRPNASAGVKLTDAELLGVPRVVVVGRRVADGVVEVRDRASGEVTEVALDDVVMAVTR